MSDIKWNRERKEEKDLARHEDELRHRVARIWLEFKESTRKKAHATPEVLKATFAETKAAIQYELKDEPSMSETLKFTNELLKEAEEKLAAMGDPLAAAERIMAVNSITEVLPDNKPGTTFGFESREAMMAVPFVQNARDADLVGFVLDGAKLVALYEGGLKENRVLGVIKFPEKVSLPSLEDMKRAVSEESADPAASDAASDPPADPGPSTGASPSPA